jgi:hypothetical protein
LCRSGVPRAELVLSPPPPRPVDKGPYRLRNARNPPQEHLDGLGHLYRPRRVQRPECYESVSYSATLEALGALPVAAARSAPLQVRVD